MDKPQVEEQRVETPTQAEPSREGRKINKEIEILLHDARENVGAPTSQCVITQVFPKVVTNGKEADVTTNQSFRYKI